MPKRYVCKNCNTLNKSKGSCPVCKDDLSELEFRHTPWTTLPYLLAGIAACILVMSHLTGINILLWFTFPLIALGLVADHFCQKKIDERALRMVVKYR